MTIINSMDSNFIISYKVIYEGVYHYKVPLTIKSNDNNDCIFKQGELVYVCETGSGYGFGISNENNFEPGYYDRDSCRRLTIQ